MNAETIHQGQIEAAIQAVGVANRPVCLHSSLRSFGYVVDGASAVIDAFLAVGCTLLTPTFSWVFAMPPPVEKRIAQNGWDYDNYLGPTGGIGRIFSPDTKEIDKDMGAIAAAVLNHPEAVRGSHPICSFAAVGPLAARFIQGQHGDNVYAPLDALADMAGMVVLAGVSLDKMTLIHLAEKQAGRNLFRRFANDANGNLAAVEVGGCSDGFEKLADPLLTLRRTAHVGPSLWQIFPAHAALAKATAAIRADPWITHCGRADCDRCNDAVKGGPVGI